MATAAACTDGAGGQGGTATDFRTGKGRPAPLEPPGGAGEKDERQRGRERESARTHSERKKKNPLLHFSPSPLL